MKEKLMALVAKLKDGLTAESPELTALANEDPVEGVEAFIGIMNTNAVELANEVPADTAATLAQVQDELVLANEGLTTLRGSHSALLLDGALLDGRITPATRPKWDEKFAAEDSDFTALANELGSIDPTMKTQRAAEDAKPGEGLVHADVIALANEYQLGGGTFEAAYGRAKRDPKFAHLFTSE